MATLSTQRVIKDLGSEEVAQLITNYNALLGVLGDLITGIKGSADHAAVVVVATAAETALEANVKTLTTEPNIPAAPSRPSY
ncbi:MAG TPA: hypothetical protein VMW36_05945 [Patescibacteria group bacterium]|nr:hypothetical protein [Patescibacteria group bacterium]